MSLLLHRLSHDGTRRWLRLKSFLLSLPCSFKPDGDKHCGPGTGFLDVPTTSEEHCNLMLPAPCLPCLLIPATSCQCLGEMKGHTEQSHTGAKGRSCPSPEGYGGRQTVLPDTAQRPKGASGSTLAYGGSRIRPLSNNNQCSFLILLAEHCPATASV